VNLSALDLVAPGGLVADLLTWEKDWRETRGFSAGAAFRGSQRQALESVVGFLRNHLPWACEHHPAVDEFAAEIRDVVRKCHTVLGDQPRRYRLDLPCPSCDLLTLVRRDGDAYIECESVECGRLWTEHEYQRLCKILVSEIGEAS
jgi:hypothetical protein